MKHGRKIFGVVCASTLGVTCAVSADVVDIPSARDNTLYEHDGGILSNGSGQHFFSGATSLQEIRRGLISFDIAAAIPPGSVINSVTLTLNCSRIPPGAGPTPISLHMVLADWGEGASDAPGSEGAGVQAEPGDATWLHMFFDTDFWANAGGDFDPTASGSVVIAGTGFYSWTSESMTTDVQGWLDNPALNFGWMLVGDEQGSRNARRFDTRENPTDANRPVLTVDFTPPDITMICPDSSTIISGITQSGSDQNICASDDARWGLQSTTFAAVFSPAPVQVEFDGNVGAGGPTISFTIEGHPTLGGGFTFMRIGMWNYTTGQWDFSPPPFTNVPDGPPDAIFVKDFDNSTGEYVDANGNVRAKLEVSKTIDGPVRFTIDYAFWSFN